MYRDIVLLLMTIDNFVGISLYASVALIRYI